MTKSRRILVTLGLAAAFGLALGGCGDKKAQESAPASKQESVVESAPESKQESTPESSPSKVRENTSTESEQKGTQEGKQKSTTEKTLEGKPWINSDFYGNWPDSQPGAEEESLRILYGFYSDKTKTDENLAFLMTIIERLKAVKTLEEMNALIKGEDGLLYGAAFVKGELQMQSSESEKYSVLLVPGKILENLPEDDDSESEPKKDLKSAKELLVRLKYSEEEANKLTEKLNGLETAEDPEVVLTEQESKLTSKDYVSLKEIQENLPVFASLVVSQGLVKEGAEGEPIYKVVSPDLVYFRKLWTEENLELLKAMAAMTIYKMSPSVSQSSGEEDVSAEAAFLSFVPRVVAEQAFVHNFVSKEKMELYPKLIEEYKEAMRSAMGTTCTERREMPKEQELCLRKRTGRTSRQRQSPSSGSSARSKLWTDFS